MSFEVELSNIHTGEYKDIFVQGKDLDSAINLIHQEYPEFILEFIGENV